MKKLIFILFFIHFSMCFAFVPTRTKYDQKLKWESRSKSLDIYVDARPLGIKTPGMSEPQVKDIISDVINDWSSWSPYDLDIVYTHSPPNLGTSKTIRFSDNNNYMGSGILAITSISHSASTGKIYSADILINDSLSNPNLYTTNPSMSGGSYAYLGDVLSHELGHFFGLGHSEVYGSTMIYSVFKGQQSLHSDDVLGLNNLYNLSQNDNSISGRIVTGNQVPVFGVQVQAISFKTGKVFAGVLTNEDGTFEINGLDKKNSYMIYVLPVRKLDSLPEYYQSIQTKYCSGKSFVPSFYTGCGNNDKGKPYSFYIGVEGDEKTQYDLGDITIRCDESLSPEYLRKKMTKQPYVVQEYSTYDQVGTSSISHVGYFSDEEISEGIQADPDALIFDLTDYEVAGGETKVLNIKISTEDIGSGLGLYAELFDSNNSLVSTQDVSLRSLSQIETMLDFNVTLSSNYSENYFTLKLYPKEVSTNLLNEIFANANKLTNKNSTYLLLTTIKNYSTGSLDYEALKNSTYAQDNYTCTEGQASSTARPNAVAVNTTSGQESSIDERNAAVSCATISDIGSGGGPGSGMMSFCLGALLIFLMNFVKRKTHHFFV